MEDYFSSIVIDVKWGSLSSNFTIALSVIMHKDEITPIKNGKIKKHKKCFFGFGLLGWSIDMSNQPFIIDMLPISVLISLTQFRKITGL
ncbi:MAG: hypothetical protein WBW72_17755 [Erwinia billingiae]